MKILRGVVTLILLMEMITDNDIVSGELLFSPPTDVNLARLRWRRNRAIRTVVFLSVILVFVLARVLVYTSTGKVLSPELHLASSPYLLPMMLVVVLILVMVVPSMALGRSPHISFDPKDIGIDFNSIRGLGPEVAEVKRTLEIFVYRDRFDKEMGGQARRGVLFEGPPGTGKTLMAKAMAKQAEVPFLYASASSFQAMYYGQTNRKIRAYFRALRKSANRYGGAIGFIDEFDAIGSSRSNYGNGSGEGVTGVVSELLVQMQSFEMPSKSRRFFKAVFGRLTLARRLFGNPIISPNVLLVAATNRVADLDPALVRPGRFDRIINFGLPSRNERLDLIEYFLASRAHSGDLDVTINRERIASKTMGYTPAMIERLFDEALVVATRDGMKRMSYANVEEAVLTVSIGLARAETYPPSQRVAIATHEAGHAVMAWASGKNRVVEMVSILKRGPSLGATLHQVAEESFLETRSDLHAMIMIALGGMVAEEILLGEPSSGAASDLVSATQIASRCVGMYGMEGIYFSLGVPGGSHREDSARVLNDPKARDLLEDLLERLYKDTVSVIKIHRDLVSKVTDALMEHEELTRDELMTILPSSVASVLDLRDS